MSAVLHIRQSVSENVSLQKGCCPAEINCVHESITILDVMGFTWRGQVLQICCSDCLYSFARDIVDPF